MKRSEIKKKPLSDTTLANLEPENGDYRVKDSGSLYFFVKKDGSKYWQYRCKDELGKDGYKGLGSYRNVSGQYARKKAKELALKEANGEIIRFSKYHKKHIDSKKNLTFEVIINDWLETKRGVWSETTFSKAKSSIERHVIKEFGHRECITIKKKEWFDFFQGLRTINNINNQVDKLISYCTNAYDLANIKGLIEDNPLVRMSRHITRFTQGNMSHVELDELPELINKVRKYPSRTMVIGIELAILLFPRPTELRCATWDQFDFKKKLWNRPAEVMKGGIAHTIPLPKQAITLLKELETYKTESPYLFPSRRTYQEPVSDGTFNTVLKRCGYTGKQTMHGFRHIASTALNNQFSDKEQVIEACLAHKKKGVKAVYDKSNHLEERKLVMQWWADYIEGIV
ncbi:tyrosine-type recombinase/integrase [Acinetobacter johnsonii]|uniref:tyrosine-type recombinase/integrase n=1 Tax=Acinetobacter johnsonii TaxID=40214 RepID=UPI0032B33BDB